MRGVFIAGAVIDGLTLVPMLVPGVAAAVFGIGDFNPAPEYYFAVRIAAALMAGWTALLVWGALRPVRRRVILLLTVFPVVAGLIAAVLSGGVQDFTEWSELAFALGILAAIMAAVLAAFIVASKLARESQSP